MAKKEKISYEEAVAELEGLVAKIESPNASLLELGDEIKRAMVLIKYCKTELKGYGAEFDKILEG